MTLEPIRANGFHFYRKGEKWLLRGVTYGPFAPGISGDSYPEEAQLRRDFAQMAAAGINTIRVYDLPGERVAQCAAENGLRLLVDIPWPKHLDVYDDAGLRQMCLDMVDEGVQRVAPWGNTLGILLGNEIPSDIVRWHGALKVERLIHDMFERAKAAAPHLLVGFANYPSTEYLELDFLDFVGFNIYLDDPTTLREYLVRLRHLYPDKPVILSECGLDSRGSSLEDQRDLLPQYVCAGFDAGLAGVMVFAWTDKWHTGGVEISDWDFGLVDRDGNPKPALEPVAAAFLEAPQCRKLSTSVSLVIATYNGGRTLRQCLDSVESLKYPAYETIVVDDGSTDDTSDILKDYPWVRVVSQSNLGLSAARNSGIQAATGEIVAFTDSDCVVDPDWLHAIALFLQDNPYMAGVGGPNITPLEDMLVQKAIALAPGHATHVLISHSEAEHVPGCNMAFRREGLIEVGGFDAVFKKAGDDVDVIWRLQDRGHSIGFSTAAFVWHHRRPTVSGYLKQQRGYGEAEALLLRKHPNRFNDRGQSVWQGIIYPTHSMRSYMGTKRVQYGTFGTAGYQCIYHTAPALWFFYATSFEWWAVCILLLIAGIFSPAAFAAGLAGIVFSCAVSAIAAKNSWPSSATYPKSAFTLVWLLWILHPLVRGGSRYWYRLHSLQGSAEPKESSAGSNRQPVRYYWSKDPGLWRIGILEKVEAEMLARQWICSPNGLWDNWDISVLLSPWFKVRLLSVEECFGEHKRLLKMRYQLIPSSLLYISIIGSLLIFLLIVFYDTILARWFLTGMLVLLLWSYRYALSGRHEVAELVDETIQEAGYMPIRAPEPSPKASSSSDALEKLAEKSEAGNV